MAGESGGATVRRLRGEDRAQWAPLWTGYLEFYGAWLQQEVYDAQFARLLAGHPMLGLVAEVDGRIVGLCHLVFHAHGWRLEEATYLQDLFVAPEARGRHVGEALIEAAYAAADAQGAPYVYWLTNEANERARRLYDRVGRFTPFVRYVRP
jgi:GNAT superfamily N-acetyltransferase